MEDKRKKLTERGSKGGLAKEISDDMRKEAEEHEERIMLNALKPTILGEIKKALIDSKTRTTEIYLNIPPELVDKYRNSMAEVTKDATWPKIDVFATALDLINSDTELVETGVKGTLIEKRAGPDGSHRYPLLKLEW